jgi:hypothetical protein
MQASPRTDPPANRYAKAIEISKKVQWDIDRDLIRGRGFDHRCKFMPDGLSLVDELGFLDAAEQRLLSQVQGRTYANMFGKVERFITSQASALSHGHSLGDQTAFEALVRFTEEELKHQTLFRRVEAMLAADMPAGYSAPAQADETAAAILSKRPWAVMALTNHIELLSLAHYRSSIDPDESLSPLWKDIFLFHWKDESQHVIIDELEWRREDARIGKAERDAAVDDLIELIGAIDADAQAQASADAAYFCAAAGRSTDSAAAREQARLIERGLLKAYRWQYIVSGATEPRFRMLLSDMTSLGQAARIQQALAPLMYAVPEASRRAIRLAA